MDGIITWLQSNWMPLLTVLITVDQVLFGIFPQVALLGSIGGILQKLKGAQPPAP